MRVGIATRSSDETEPPRCCTTYVTIEEIIESANKGAFSITSRDTGAFGTRRSGHASNRSITKGSVTTMGFDISPQQNSRTTSR